MNIKDNILNYLYDRDYCMCMYDDYFYIFNYKYLDLFNENRIILSLSKKKLILNGNNLLLVKITKEELLIRGSISNIEVKNDEQ